MGFPPDSQVDVRQIDEKNLAPASTARLRRPVGAVRDPDRIGYRFRFGPPVFVWFLPRYGRYTKAAILHDYLWRQLAAKGKMTYIDADGIFRRAMRELGVPFLRRWILWAAVRVGALVKKGGTKHWWRESWRVLLVSVIALPVVLPPAIVIVVALVLFYILELIAWVVLAIITAIQSSLMKRADVKQVNMPRLTWKL